MSNTNLTLDTALALLNKSNLQVLAGGTDFYPALGEGQAPEQVLDVTRIEELAHINLHDGVWRIGAAVTWRQLMDSELPAMFDCLKQAAKDVGSIQIQNKATLVGNICNASPAADGVPGLLALDAEVKLESSASSRILPLQEFLCGVRQTALRHDELLTEIHIPDLVANTGAIFKKLGSRSYLVISIVMLAVVLELDDAQRVKKVAIAVGACSAVAKRLSELESHLLGKTLTKPLLDNLITPAQLSVLSPIDDVRGSAQYRLDATAVILRRAFLSLAQDLHHA